MILKNSRKQFFRPVISLVRTVLQRRKKRTQPPPKENLLENFSGLKEKLSRPVVDTKTYKNQEIHIHHQNLSSVDLFFSAKKSSALEQGGAWFLFQPRGSGETSKCLQAILAARQFLPLNCRAITLTAGATAT